MSEDDIFAGIKKKKKSKKVDFNPEDEVAPAEATEERPAADEEAKAEDDVEDAFANLKKKKKKSANKDLLGNDVVEESTEVVDTGDVAPEALFDDLKKKKKKSKKAAFDLEQFERELAEDGPAAAGAKGAEGDDDDDGGAAPEYKETELGDNVFGEGSGAAESAAGGDSDEHQSWIGTDREYTYDELLSRAFRILRNQNPELAGDRRRYNIPTPAVQKEGNKKTIFGNLADICKRMHRQDEHVISFLFAELGTSGSVDGSHRLVIKGRYTQKNMENVLRRYIVEYVTCKTCKSPDTLLAKENRIFFMNCMACGSRRSVNPIKSGFQAQIGRRKAQKAA